MNQKLLVFQSFLVITALIMLASAHGYWRAGSIEVVKMWAEKDDPVIERVPFRPGILALLPVLEDTPKNGFRVIYSRDKHAPDYYYQLSLTVIPALLLLTFGLTLHLFWWKAVERWEIDVLKRRSDRSQALLDETLRNRKDTSGRPGFKTGKAQ